MQRNVPPQTDDLDVPRLMTPLRRHLLPILSAALLAGGLTYTLSSRKPPVYTTMSSVALASSQLNGAGDASLVAGQFLPLGALQQTLRDAPVAENVAQRILSSELPATQAQPLAQAVRTATAPLVKLVSLQGQQTGVYEVWGSGATPAAAQVLVNASVDALLDWDRQRTRERIAQTRTSLQQQLITLNRLKPAPEASDIRYETYRDAQVQLLRTLARFSALEQAPVSTLNVVSRAPLPSAAERSSPVGRAVLAALLALFGASAAALLFEAWRRRVYDAHHLRDLGLPVLGHLPRLGAPGAAGTSRSPLSVVQARPLQDSLGFVRLNVLSQLTAHEPRRLVFCSVREGAGTSSVVAALAASLASGGRRVLIVDLHPVGAGQQSLWSDVSRSGMTLSPAGEGAPRRVADDIGLLCLPDVDPKRANPDLGGLAAGYDVTLVDAPPILQSSEALMWGSRAAGIVLIIEPGTNSVHEVERAQQSADLARVRILGAVLNEMRLPNETRTPAGAYQATTPRHLSPEKA